MDPRVIIAHQALDASGGAIRPYFRAGLNADQKTDQSPVTIADREAETILRDILTKAFPDYGIIGEEFPAHNPDAKYVWVIDPIDGTRAFITGRPSFCTLLGLLEDGEPILGFIDQPITRERWSGGRDTPVAFTGPFGGSIGPRNIAVLNQAELSSTSPEMFGTQLPRFTNLKDQCRRMYWGGDAYAYGLLTLGQIDLVAEYDLKPWDWAALAPIVIAAGGFCTDWGGAPLRLGQSDGSVLAAATPSLHDAAITALLL